MAPKTAAQKAADAEAGAAKDAVTQATPETEQGGAVVQEVTVETFEPEADEVFTMNIVTTAPGTFGLGGIEKDGTPATINCSAFSAQWMKPSTKADEAKLKAYRASL